MKKRAILATAILFAAPAAARADYFDTGNDYWAKCSGDANLPLCMGLASGYLDMMNAFGSNCSASGVSRRQAKDVFVKFLAEHPEHRNLSAAALAGVAFTDAFGCKKPEKHGYLSR
jgi:hypothetical protein